MTSNSRELRRLENQDNDAELLSRFVEFMFMFTVIGLSWQVHYDLRRSVAIVTKMNDQDFPAGRSLL